MKLYRYSECDEGECEPDEQEQEVTVGLAFFVDVVGQQEIDDADTQCEQTLVCSVVPHMQQHHACRIVGGADEQQYKEIERFERGFVSHLVDHIHAEEYEVEGGSEHQRGGVRDGLVVGNREPQPAAINDNGEKQGYDIEGRPSFEP